MHHKPKSAVAEAFRSLRTAVLFSFPDNPPRTILITSFIPKEGKTFIAANLALVMAYAGESVLLVDADMRKPQLHKIFGLDNRKGLSNVIVGEEPTIHRVSSARKARYHDVRTHPSQPGRAPRLEEDGASSSRR